MSVFINKIPFDKLNSVCLNVYFILTEPKNCASLKKIGFLDSGNYKIDPDGVFDGVDPMTVYCNMSGDTPAMVISHDSEARGHVRGCEPRGCFTRNILYTAATLPQITALVKMSGNCKQYFKYECHSSGLWDGWWLNRNGEMRQYWGGNNPGYVNVCECGITQTCDSDEANERRCNCNVNDSIWRKDEGYLTDVDDLPVTQLRFGDTGTWYEEGYYTLGKLFCF